VSHVTTSDTLQQLSPLTQFFTDTVTSVDDKNDPPWSPEADTAWSTESAKTRRKRLNRERRSLRRSQKNRPLSSKTPSKSYCSSVTSLMSPGYEHNSSPSASEDSKTVTTALSLQSPPRSLDWVLSRIFNRPSSPPRGALEANSHNRANAIPYRAPEQTISVVPSVTTVPTQVYTTSHLLYDTM
jgi:hypothetical protein